MLPVLYSIGTFNVYSFGIFVALAFLMSTFIVWKLGREELKEELYLDAYFYTSLVSLVSARAVYIIRNWQDFQFIFLKYFLVVETPGLSLLGGAIGGFIFLYFYCRRRKLNFFHLADILSVTIALALFFIKIGQQLGGAAFGTQTVFFIKVKIVGREGFYHPVELYESLVFLLLFVLLFFLYKKAIKRKWNDGIVFSIFGFITALLTIVLEFIKVYRLYLYGFSFRQILGIIISAGAMTLFLVRTSLLKKILNNFKKTK